MEYAVFRHFHEKTTWLGCSNEEKFKLASSLGILLLVGYFLKAWSVLHGSSCLEPDPTELFNGRFDSGNLMPDKFVLSTPSLQLFVFNRPDESDFFEKS